MFTLSQLKSLSAMAVCLAASAGFAENSAPAALAAPPKIGEPNSVNSHSIQNEFYKIEYANDGDRSDTRGRFTITHRPSGKIFVKDFTVNFSKQVQGELITNCPVIGNGIVNTPHNLPSEPINDPILGAGYRLSCDGEAGAMSNLTTSLELYKGVPFVIVRQSLRSHHDSRGITDISKFSPASFDIDLAKNTGELKTLGTGGLLTADKNPGSHLFLTTADPESRNGVVVGWISQNIGSGVVFSEMKSKKIAIRPELHFGHLFLHNNFYWHERTEKFCREDKVQDWSGKKVFDRRQLETARNNVKLDPFVIGYFEDARLGNELYAELIAKFNKIKIRPQSAVYCTWYADKNGGEGSADSTAKISEFVAKNLKDFGMDTIQIDDKWQAGTRYSKPAGYPASHFDKVNPKGRYPNGIAPTAKIVDDLGLRLGLWWLPFGRHHFEPEYAEKQHWFIHRLDGTPYRTKSFGGTCLDITHPEVQEHLRVLARDMRQWGVKYFKMDGLWSGLATDTYYINDGYKDDKLGDHKPFYDLGKTNVEAYRLGLETIRKGAGDDVFFSGCNVAQNMRTLSTTIGLVDAMRIGPDYNHDGKGIQTGPLRGSRFYFLNGKVWWNDPDPVKVRAKNGGVSLDHARLATSWVAHSGQFFLISDWLPNLDPDRVEVLKRTMSPHNAISRPVDYFDKNLPEVWLLTQEAKQYETKDPDVYRKNNEKTPRRDVLALYNWTKKEKTVSANLARAGLDASKTWHAFDFWANKPLPDIQKEIQSTLPKESCQIIAIRPAIKRPVLVSTSRHITQGVLDVQSETWNSVSNKTGTLSGTSELLAGDAYELRIAGLGKTWKIEKVLVIGKEGKIDAKYNTNDADWLRIQIPAPAQNETASWTIHFKKTDSINN